MKSTLVSCVLLAMVVSCSGAADDQWTSLFDGKSLEGWTSAAGKPVTAGWKAEDGVLRRAAKGGDIYTAKEYGDFELAFEWKISPKGNSGVKYRVMKFGNGLLGMEYQVLDDGGHVDGKKPGGKNSAASLYDIIPPNDSKKLNPVGEWNTSRIVAKGDKIEHWLNGEKVIDVDTSSESFQQALAKSKFARTKGFARQPAGRIMIQDHGNEAWFRNIRIRELK